VHEVAGLLVDPVGAVDQLSDKDRIRASRHLGL
jgi:hypothetical protein